MSCTPFVVNPGLFIDANSTAWSNAPNTTMGGKTVTKTAAGITATGPTGSVFHSELAGRVLRYMFFGSNNYLLILDSETGGGAITRRVSLIDFTTTPPTEKPIITGLASSSAVPQPNVQYSQGTGSAFLIFNSTGTEIQNLGIYRGDNGTILCPGPPPFVATLEISGEATATELRIKHGGTTIASCPLPSGNCSVQPTSQTFPDAVVGGAPALAATTRQFTIRNTGNDCLTINAIGNVPPFSVTATSIPLPASLNPGQMMTVTVTFSPSTIGVFGPTNLPITRTPAKGDSALVCRGTGRQPIRKIGFSATSLSFGKVPVGTPKILTLQIQNRGETDLNASLAASPPGSPFQWSAFNGVLPYGGSQPLPITFTPIAEGSATATISVTSNDPASPSAIALSGEGCIANADILVPPAAPINFGQIQRGFRTVRFITIKNTGDGPLTFTGRITGADASLYGLQLPEGSITDVLSARNYTVDPVSPCGALSAGSGETIVAVAFFANDTPRTTNAQLIIENINATNVPSGTTYSFNLTAEIIASVAVDAGLVLDRSGSMAELAGARTKSEAAIAAGRLFAQLIRPDVDDRLTVVKFNQTPEVLEPIALVTSANQPTIVGKINGTELAPSGSTSIAGGVLVCLKQLNVARATVPPALNKAMVVLTDGKDNTAYLNPDDGQRYSVLGGVVDGQNTIPVPHSAGIKIYAIGLGREENIDRGQLNQLSQATGAYYGVVGDLVGQSYFNLEKYFTQIYMNMVDTSPLLDPVFTIVPGEEQKLEFDVLRGDVSALVVIYDREGRRLPFYLISPKGELIEVNHIPPVFQLRSGFTDTARFMELFMPLGEPDRYAGRWTVVVTHPGEVCFGNPRSGNIEGNQQGKWGFLPSRCIKSDEPIDYGIAIGVGSNFRMQPFVTPGIVRVGDPIVLTAVVSEAGLPVTGCTVTVKAVSPSGVVWNLPLWDDGTHNDSDPNDGEYARQFTHTDEGGSYEFTFRAVGASRDGEPVIREAVLAKYVEGRIKIEPDPGRSGDGDECCRQVLPLLWIGIVLLAILVLLAIIITVLLLRR